MRFLNLVYSRALARLFVPGLDMRIGSAVAVAGIRSTLLRGTEALPEFGPHSASYSPISGRTKKSKQPSTRWDAACFLHLYSICAY